MRRVISAWYGVKRIIAKKVQTLCKQAPVWKPRFQHDVN